MKIRIQDLYTFHVVMRTGAMQDAALELGVTPGAISQRIRAIEERHGQRLFFRSKNGISPTAAGLALKADTSAAFSEIETAHIKHFSKNGNTIRISTSATFAHSVLVSSLGSFADSHPKIKISIETSDHLADLTTEPIDLAIRHGLGDYKGLSAKRLCSPELIVVGSPALLQKHSPVKNPQDCLRHTLLPDATNRDWPLWFEAQNIDASSANYGTRYGNDFLTVKAAIEGQGLALLNSIYVQENLNSGQLVRALNGSWSAKFAYYLVALPEVMDRPAVKTLVNWLADHLSSSPATID